MRGHRRRVGTSAAVTVVVAGVVVGTLAAPAALRAAAPLRHAPAASATIGHLAYLTNAGALDTVVVHANGSTSGRRQIGPQQPSSSAHPVVISSLVASQDGRWLAWSEFLQTSKTTATSRLVLWNQVAGTAMSLSTARQPVGFAGDTLLAFENHVTKLVRTPSPHFVRVAGNFPITTYAHGVLDASINSKDTVERLRLTSLSGHHLVLHRYTDIGAPDYREVSQGWVSSDGSRLVVERGDHTDFGGLGPSSAVDEFRLSGSHARSQLGHYGALHGEWRVGAVAFRGHSDVVWAAFEALRQHGVSTAVAHYSGGRWVTLRHGVVDVAANRAGDLVVQRGRYVLTSPDGNGYSRHATEAATLTRHGTTHSLGIRGTQFFWVR